MGALRNPARERALRIPGRDPVLVLVVLVAATVLSWVLSSDGGSTGAAAVVVLLVAVVKVRLIGTWFMELRDAPRVLRLIFDGWCLLLAGVLAGPYLVG